MLSHPWTERLLISVQVENSMKKDISTLALGILCIPIGLIVCTIVLGAMLFRALVAIAEETFDALH